VETTLWVGFFWLILILLMWGINFSKFLPHRCRDCGYRGKLIFLSAGEIMKFLLLMIFPEASGEKKCPKCGSRQVEMDDSD